MFSYIRNKRGQVSKKKFMTDWKLSVYSFSSLGEIPSGHLVPNYEHGNGFLSQRGICIHSYCVPFMHLCFIIVSLRNLKLLPYPT